MKLKVQAQHLQIGDIVGSGERVEDIILNSTKWPSSKICVILGKEGREGCRSSYWGKYTEININRPPTDIIDIKPVEKQPIKSNLRRFEP